jgi:hypothetical protein
LNHGYPLDEAERVVMSSDRRGLVGNPNVLMWLLGREVTTVDEWIDDELREADLACH